MPASDSDFASRLLRWHADHGRHDLPWQHPRDPYRVWLSEIMLQQTQVATVIPYFLRFSERFSDIRALAAADLDEVLSLWSGLGYYARARNLHACAQAVVDRHDGQFPEDAEELVALPGIGRSTAHAILAQAYGQPRAILDANVKRVLARHAGIAGWPGKAPIQKQLWDLAEQRMPQNQAADYTQAIMDLGATCCRARKPQCSQCPVSDDCVALAGDRVDQLPTPKPRKAKPQRVQYLALELDADRIRLSRRPPIGIWGGLWCPELAETPWPPADAGTPERPSISHSFTHFDLELRPQEITRSAAIADQDARWFTLDEALELGLPAPIRRLIQDLRRHRFEGEE